MSTRNDFNRGNNEGCGYFRVTQRRGVRVNAAQAFLKPAMNRPNLTVLTKAEVSTLDFEGGRAVGASLTLEGRPARIRAGRELILPVSLSLTVLPAKQLA